jgi:hypothetical protein
MLESHSWHVLSGDQDQPELTASELRLLPVLTTSRSLNEIAQALEMPTGVVLELAQSIYAKLGPMRVRDSGLTGV